LLDSDGENRYAKHCFNPGSCRFYYFTVTEVAMDTEATVSKDKLVQDFRIVIADAEELLRATASQAGEKVAAARERIQDSLHTAKVKLAEAEDVIIQQSKLAMRATDEYVQENPWRAVGIAAGVGLIIGLLIGRR
jgi:ElaB/YqjD/DUF883 family membrane-anchored ribosome-binding protein